MIEPVGRNIYGEGEVRRRVYEVQSVIRRGNSGGPFVLPDGRVAGVVFANSVVADDVGYAIVSTEVLPSVKEAKAERRTGRHRLVHQLTDEPASGLDRRPRTRRHGQRAGAPSSRRRGRAPFGRRPRRRAATDPRRTRRPGCRRPAAHGTRHGRPGRARAGRPDAVGRCRASPSSVGSCVNASTAKAACAALNTASSRDTVGGKAGSGFPGRQAHGSGPGPPVATTDGGRADARTRRRPRS